MHFTIDCSFYDDIRFKMLQSFDTSYNGFMSRTSLEKFCTIMSEKDVSLCKLLAKTVDNMFKRRQSFM